MAADGRLAEKETESLLVSLTHLGIAHDPQATRDHVAAKCSSIYKQGVSGYAVELARRVADGSSDLRAEIPRLIARLQQSDGKTSETEIAIAGVLSAACADAKTAGSEKMTNDPTRSLRRTTVLLIGGSVLASWVLLTLLFPTRPIASAPSVQESPKQAVLDNAARIEPDVIAALQEQNKRLQEQLAQQSEIARERDDADAAKKVMASLQDELNRTKAEVARLKGEVSRNQDQLREKERLAVRETEKQGEASVLSAEEKLLASLANTTWVGKWTSWGGGEGSVRIAFGPVNNRGCVMAAVGLPNIPGCSDKLREASVGFAESIFKPEHISISVGMEEFGRFRGAGFNVKLSASGHTMRGAFYAEGVNSAGDDNVYLEKQ
jgi:hypothetical protein